MIKRWVFISVCAGLCFVLMKLYQHNSYVRQSYFLEQQRCLYADLLKNRNQLLVDLEKARDYELVGQKASSLGYRHIKHLHVVREGSL